MLDRWNTAYLSGLTHMASSAAAGTGAFYFMEDLCFAEFPDGLACFMIDNDA